MDNPENYLNHSLNTSVSKQAYTFCKSTRQSLAKKVLNSSFYDVPSMKSQRACSFGVGSKINIANKSFSPPPGAYQAKSEFQTVNSNAISFSKSRDQVKFGYFLETAERLKKMPAPNHYKIKLKTMSKRGGRISERLPTDIDQIKRKKVPGPGTYNLKGTNLSESGSFFLAKYINSRSPRMHEQSRSSSTQRKMKTQIGPSSYQPKDGQFGKSILSKFRNSVSGSFGKSDRPSLADKSKLKNPGYKYKRFSDFGFSS